MSSALQSRPPAASNEQRIGVYDTLRPGLWIKLVVGAVRDVGPAAQTLGGILNVTSSETFCSAGRLAQFAHLPLPTVRKHLVALESSGWIANQGRCRTRAGAPRRTCTIAVTSRTKFAKDTFLILPWWASRFPWSSRAVLGVVMERLCELRAVVQRSEHLDDDLYTVLQEFHPRFCFGLDELQERTGLTRPSIIQAKRHLSQTGSVHWHGSDAPGYPDLLVPNPTFQVVWGGGQTRFKWSESISKQG